MTWFSSRPSSSILCWLLLCFSIPDVWAFVPGGQHHGSRLPSLDLPITALGSSNNNNNNNNDFLKESTPGGFTVKQRLREEVEFPFRSVRLFFFGYSTVSALVALYFSLLNTLKASIGGYTDVPPLQECYQNDAINLGGALVCGALVYRDWQAGKANLNRIAKGGQLAQLVVEPATATATTTDTTSAIRRVPLAAFRRQSRVVICAGGASYMQRLAASLASDQLEDENTLPRQLQACDVVVVPVLMEENSDKKKTTTSVVDTASFWNQLHHDTNLAASEEDESSSSSSNKNVGRNFDIQRAASVIHFPRGTTAWQEYLQSEIDTAQKQGFNVLEKGITLTIKKNGKILRRATGLPPWGDLISTMEVMDGSKFGMPGDDEKYGGN